MVRTYLVTLVGWIRDAVGYEKDVAVAHKEIYFLIFGPNQSVPDWGSFCQRLAANCLREDGLPECWRSPLAGFLLTAFEPPISYQ
jgi:hypothetical protein